MKYAINRVIFPSEVYPSQAAVQSALDHYNLKIVGFRTPRGERYLTTGLVPATATFIPATESPRFIVEADIKENGWWR
jgi:hypothetical protein